MKGVLGVLPELCISVPSGEIEGEIKNNLVVGFWQQPLDDRDPALRKPSTLCMVTPEARTYLQNIFIVSCGELLQRGNTPTKSPDGVTTKCWNLTEPERYQ